MALESSSLGPVAAFLSGMVSFLSPCVLPLVPGYVPFIAGTAAREPASASGTRWTPPLLALVFVLGFATVFISLGATTSVIGGLLLQYGREAVIVGGVVIMLFGLLMWGSRASVGSSATSAGTPIGQAVDHSLCVRAWTGVRLCLDALHRPRVGSHSGLVCGYRRI